MDWRTIDRNTNDRKRQVTGRGQNKGIYQGLTESVNSETQSMRVTYAGGEKTMTLPMPFDSTNSWIRCVPESASTVLLCTRSDTSDVAMLRYLGDKSDVRVAQYKQGIGLYRPLLGGEIEINSSGNAQTYYSTRPLLEQRAGAIRSWLDQDRAEAGAFAPTHVRQLWEHASEAVNDEERFGAVKRPRSLNPANAAVLATQTGNASLASYNYQEYPYPDFSLPAGVPAAFGATAQALATASEVIALTTGKFKTRPFAKEYLRVIKNPLIAILPQMPKLIDIREGQVFEDSGNPLISGTVSSASGQAIGANQSYLRARYKYFTTLGDSTDCEIDEIGDISWKLSTGAINGFTLNIPTGPYSMNCGQTLTMKTLMDMDVTATTGLAMTSYTTMDFKAMTDATFTNYLNFTHTTKGSHTIDSTMDASISSSMNMNLKAQLTATVEGGTMGILKAPQIQIGSSPSTACVMGNELMQWLLDIITAFQKAQPIGNMGYPVLFSSDPALAAALSKAASTASLWLSKTIQVSP